MPNVLVIMADQMKASSSHLYGSGFCHTPSLERLARRGTMFETAITPQPLCVPARVALWTARWPHATGARLNETPMPNGERHAFRLWKEAGFTTALIGKDHCFADAADRAMFDVRCPLGHDGLPAGDEPTGMDWVVSRERVAAAHAVRRAMPRQGPALSYAVSDVDPEATSTGLVAAQACAWLERVAMERAARKSGTHERTSREREERPADTQSADTQPSEGQPSHGQPSLDQPSDDQPFAAWISFPDPHTPYEVPREWAETVPPENVELPPPQAADDAALPERTRVLRRLLDVSGEDEGDLRAAIAVYHAQVRFVDAAVGRILDTLDRLGMTRDTIVVFCADHGDFAGEHGMTRKGGAFYDCLVRVPLIVSWPGRVPEGVVDRSLVNLLDIVPTLLWLQGLAAPNEMQGELLPSVTSAPPREATFSEYGAGGAFCTLADLESLRNGLEASSATLRWREAEGRRKMVRTRRWKFITDPMGDLDELYDLEADPFELTNLAPTSAQRPEHEQQIAALRRLLFEWSVTTEDHRAIPLPEPTFAEVNPQGSTS